MSEVTDQPITTDDEPTDQPEAPRENPLWQFTRVVGTAVLVAAAILLILSRQRPSGVDGIGPGAEVPTIEAVGWINGPPPDFAAWKGQVIVIDEWASWCGPCRRAAPHLVELEAKYRDRGVQFLGLTREAGAAFPDVEEFIEHAKISWPNGYGAEETLIQFGSMGIPAVWVVGRDGKIAWNRGAGGELEDAIERALAVPDK